MPSKVIVGLPGWYLVGPYIFAERLVQGLNSQGWDARVLLTEQNTCRVQEQQQTIPAPDNVPCDVLPAGFNDTWGMRWEALNRYLEEHAPCFYIMVHDWRNNVVASRLSDRVFLIGLVQADYELELDQAHRLGHLWNAIVTVSDPLHFSLACRLPIHAPRIVTIRNAVPGLETIPPKSETGPLRIAYSGELRHSQKRLDDMVKIAHRLAERGTPFELTFFGDGPFRAELEQQAGLLVERGQVRFAGRRHSSEILVELEQQHVFLLTSEFEGLSIALLEAMSRGCVPVVSNLATQSLVIRHGVNSFSAPVGDIDAFTKHLVTLAEDPCRRQTMANAAFETIIEGGYRVEDMIKSYVKLFDRISTMSRRRNFVRPRSLMGPPPTKIGNVGILPANTEGDINYVNATELWPNPPRSHPSSIAVKRSSAVEPIRLEDYKVIVAIPAGQISGVDMFATHLVRQLRTRGLDAKILGSPHRDHSLGLPLASNLPMDERKDEHLPTWLERWKAMTEYLESQAPCIYIPNYDYDYSGVAPWLSNRVKVVCISHSDDPVHYEHTLRIGHASDAIVGVSTAISKYLGEIDPTLIPRLHTIPYGIPLPAALPEREFKAGAPLRIAYVGRFLKNQKRATDIIEVAQSLERRGIPFEMIAVGDGPDRESMEEMGRELVSNRRLFFPGKLPNDEVMKLLESCDAFLLPSAFEGLSVGLLEAMSRGLVPVVSDIRSGVPDVIRDGVNGFIAPTGNTERFADHLAYLYQNSMHRKYMSTAAYQTIATGGYRIEDMVDRYVDLLQTVVTQPFARKRGPMVPPRYLAIENSPFNHWWIGSSLAIRKRYWAYKAFVGWVRCWTKAGIRRLLRIVRLMK